MILTKQYGIWNVRTMVQSRRSVGKIERLRERKRYDASRSFKITRYKVR